MGGQPSYKENRQGETMSRQDYSPNNDAAHGQAHASTDDTLNARTKTAGRGPRRRIWILVAAIAAVAVLVTAIAVNVRRAPAPKSRASTVSIGLKLAPTNLDIRTQSGSALDQILIGNVYEGLVSRNSRNEVSPALAASWGVSSDGLTYTFHLHHSMRFSNGDALDADDVAWSIQQLIDKHYQDADLLRNFSSIRAMGPDTVQLRLSAPYSDLLWSLSGRAGLVFDRRASYDPKTQAVGSGPYTISKFVANTSITLHANPRYWGANKATTPTIVVRYFADDNAAVNALRSGDVQVLAPITESLAAPLKKDSGTYVVKAGDDTDKYVLAFNMHAAGVKDVRVRKAMRYGIDHAQIIASRGGADAALGGPIPSLDPGYENLTGLYPHDLAKARRLMAQAGYSEKNPLRLRLTYANTYGAEIGTELRSQLRKIGIDLTVTMVEFSTWLQDVYTNKDYDLSLVDHNESHDFYQWADPDYYFGYDNAQVRRLYQEAMSAVDTKRSAGYLAQAARIVSEDAPADWLFNYRVTTAYRRGLTGFPLNLNQTLLALYRVAYTPEA
jgi:peptide/nickel transport system substrate-binding protein